MIALGIDPGTGGALAVFGPDVPNARPGPDGSPVRTDYILMAWDMPTNEITVGGKPRKRIDMLGLGEMIDAIMDIYAPTKVVIEKVSGMPGQSGMFEFGFTVGCIHQALAERKIAFEMVTPTQWKKDLKAPRDKKECVAKCDALWPERRALFRTDTGKKGLRPDRAEAALLAYWATGVWK